jgi:hypothetical protein
MFPNAENPRDWKMFLKCSLKAKIRDCSAEQKITHKNKFSYSPVVKPTY